MNALFLVFLFAVHLSVATACSGAMQYSLVFRGMWSSARHPVLYPSNAHFSPVVVVSHSEEFTLWAPGSNASEGVQIVAETGNPTPLRLDLQSEQVDGLVSDITHANGPIDSVDFVKLDITVDKAHPYVSLISMLAPSPDWFTGFQSINMCDGGKWRQTLSLDDLAAYDAGTDSGMTFTADDEPTNPQDVITKIECGNGVFCGVGEDFLPVASVVLQLAGDQCKGSQLYSVEFKGMWTRATHPVAYPTDAHFSPPVFATHTRGYSFVNSGEFATDGVQQVAETGATSMILDELNSARKSGFIGDYTTGPTSMIYADTKHALFSLISMAAPSPDWVVSKTVQLCDPHRNRWMDEVVIGEVDLYDAGTDAGMTFLSDNEPEDPKKAISSFGCGRGVFCGPGETLAPLAQIVLKAIKPPTYCKGSRTYSVQVQGMWSGARHPILYPSDGHFSPPVVAAHGKGYQFFNMDDPVTPGVQTVAETGDPGMLKDELFEARMQGSVGDLNVGEGGFDSTGESSEILVTVDPSNSHISVITMVAPSPDWFISVTMNMCDERRGKWMSKEKLDADVVYDAGTDDGETFTADNEPTEPQENVRVIECGEGVFCAEDEEINTMAQIVIRRVK